MTLISQETVYLIIRKGSLKQKLICLLIGLFVTIVSIQQFIVNFETPFQDYWCSVPQLEKCSYSQQKELIAPRIASHQTQDYCSLRNANWSHYEQTCEFENVEGRLEKDCIKCETGFKFDDSMFTFTATSRFQLVCDYAWLHMLLSPVFLFSGVIGSFLSGFISDGYGRKFSLLIFVIIHAVGGCTASFAPNVWLFLVGRILIGISISAVGITCFTLLIEIVPTVKLEVASMLYEVNYNGGVLLITFLAYFVRDYRWLQLSSSLMVLPLLLFFAVIPESPLWLISNGHHSKALKELKRLCSWAGMPFPNELLKEYTDSKEVDTKSQILDKPIHKESLSICDILKHKRLLFYIIANTIGYLAANASYLGAGLNMELFFGNIYVNMMASGLLEMISFVFFCILMNKYGRRTLNLVLCALQIVLHLTQIVFLLIPGYEMVTTIVALICKVLPIMQIPIILIMSAELFPTPIRQQALGCIYGLSGTLTSVCPIIGGATKMIWAPIPNIIFGSLMILTFVTNIFLPETKNRKIPSTLEEALYDHADLDKMKKISNVESPDNYILNSEYRGTFFYIMR